MWLDKIQTELEEPTSKIILQILGWKKYNLKTFNHLQKNLNKFLKMINNHLATRTYLIGYHLTLPDIILAFLLLQLFRHYFDQARRKKYRNLTRYYDFLVHQTQIEKRIGRVQFCEEMLLPIECKNVKEQQIIQR